MNRNFLAFFVAGIFALGVLSYGATSMVSAQNGDVPAVIDASVKKQGDSLHIQIQTDDKLAKDGSQGLYGYGVLTNGLENVLAVTTHLCAADSPVQGAAGDDCPATIGVLTALGLGVNEEHNDATWHPHILDLTKATGACKKMGADLEVDLASTLAGNNVSPDPEFEADWEFGVGATTINVVAPINDANVADNEDAAVVSFEIGAAWDDNGTITDLCVLNVQ